MLQVACNICQRKLNLPYDTPKPHFCEGRCLPFAEEYNAEVQKLSFQHMQEFQGKLNKLREKFLQERVLPNEKKQNLKAVSA